MANLFERIFMPSTSAKLLEAAATLETAQRTISAKSFEVDDLKESMSELSLYLEDLNWVPISGWQKSEGFTLKTVKEQADRCRALLAVNPTIKKAINARVGYIWGRGVSFKGSGFNSIVNNPRNQSILFDDAAKWVIEAKLATDGNIWTTKSRNGELVNVPIDHIGGWVLDETDPSRVLYWLVNYTVMVKNFATGVEAPKTVEKFYPADDFTGVPVKRIDDIPVDTTSRIIHLAANRQDTWILGIPDIMAAMFWAKAHKELFESGTTYVKAQGKFASKVVSKSPLGATNAAARVAEAPRRDPQSGEIMDTGGTAVMSGGLDYQLMGKMTGGVDFDNFDPVAGLVAVGLGIPLHVILGNADTPDQSLEQSVVNEMQMRQKLWSRYFKSVLGLDRKVEVAWPKIRTEPEYRRVQSVELSNKSNTLTPQELRQLTLEAYDLDGDPTKLPDVLKNNFVMIQNAIADHAAELAADAAQQAADNAEKLAATTPEQGVDAGIGKLSTGGDAKASRDDKTDTNTKNK